MANSGEEHLAALRCLDDTTDGESHQSRASSLANTTTGFDSIRLPGDYHLEALFSE